MSAAVSLASFEGAGWAFRLDAGKVKATPPPGACEADISALRTHRDTIRAELVSRQVVTPCPAELTHNAAVIAQDGGCSWSDALDGAAAGFGLASHDDAVQVVLDEWRQSIRAAKPETERGRQAVADALRMLDDAGLDLCAHGWAASDLFGLHRGGDRHGLAFRLAGGVVDIVTADQIRFRAGAVGRLSRFTRLSTASSAVPFFELHNES